MATLQVATATAGIALADARFIDLVTFRRSGAPVGTPVLFVQDGSRRLVRTAAGAGKLKRLAHTPDVELTPCDSKGVHLGVTLTGTARILGPEAVGPALRAIHAKHRIAGPIATFVRRRKGQPDVI